MANGARGTPCATLALVLLASLDAAHGRPKPAASGMDGMFVRLQRHSFQKTLTYDSGLADWLASAATMPLRDRVSVMPGVPDRHGLFWNKQALKTSDFELEFSFVAKAKPGSDGVFAAWISPDNFTATYDEQAIITTSKAGWTNWTKGLENTGRPFIGNKPDFKGLGVFFLASDVNGGARQAVHAVWNPGDKQMSLPEIRRAPLKTIDWLNVEMTVRLRVKADGSIVGSMCKTADATNPAKAVELFSLPPGTRLGDSAYIGFSSWSGTKTQIVLDMNSLETRNFDLSKSGEANEEAAISDESEWMKVLQEEKKYLSQASQMEAVKRLTKLLGDHVVKYQEMGDAMKVDVSKLEKRLDNLGGDFGKLFSETESFDFQKGSFNVDAVRDHIKSVSTILTQGSQQHATKLAEVHGVAQDLKAKGGAVMGEAGKQKVQSVSEQSKILEENAARGSTQTSGLLIILVLSVAGLGMLFLNRMWYYEKKHYI